MDAIKSLISILCVGLLAGCGGGGGGGMTTPNLPPPTNTVSGIVTFKGAPLSGATVIAYSTNSNVVFATTTTDANGNYSVSGLGTGCTSCTPDYQFFVSKAGYAFSPYLSSPSGSRAGWLFDPVPQNWYLNPGAALTRAGYNGAFTNSNGGAGIIFSVINFMSVANHPVSGADFTAYDGSNPPASLPASGQQIIYVAGDDASVHKGIAWTATRFVDNQNGTVTDNLTGLIWLKNAGCFAPTVWATALADVNQLASGACGLNDGSTAGQWRLPNIIELESRVDESASNPAVTAGSPFINVSNGIYWSSTGYYGGEAAGANFTTAAWAIRFSDGRYINDSVSNNMKTSSNAVWAVKGNGGGAIQLASTGYYVPSGPGDDGTVQAGAPLPAPRMRDNGNGTVTDTVAGLIWMKQADCINQPWAAAVAAVKTLASGQCGLTDGSVAGSWRMPNRKEMQSLADRAQNNQALYFNESFVSGSTSLPSQPAIFNNMVGFNYYWTSTTDAANTGLAWTVFSCDWGVYDINKTVAGYTLAVR